MGKFGINSSCVRSSALRTDLQHKGFSVESSQGSKSELETVRYNFLIKKLGLSVSDKLEEGISKVIEQYGASNRNKYRTVAYYLLTKHFGKKLMY